MKTKLLAALAFVLFSGIFTACSEESIEPNTEKKDMAKGATKDEKNW
ncbi:hypothetical protein [Fulvivirga sedimenti]|uniref:Uncharacterized protein n=1 Tax=Fulvivirga sedimenti TaxID=2879465 RepID=A0A9X1HKR1_9BACT|nr:hypothetical protein [Fulvivirga sedimenti]MCA6073785.1 hypothetical protein [Fulvivirga sedimenti]